MILFDKYQGNALCYNEKRHSAEGYFQENGLQRLISME